jgi:hypothetical protein
MTIAQVSAAVSPATAHCEAWSNHDWDAARRMLADDVKVTATTTRPIMPETNLTGADAYMSGLRQFAGAIVRGRPGRPGPRLRHRGANAVSAKRRLDT